MAALTNQAEAALILASRQPIVAALAALRIPSGARWLPASHPASQGVIPAAHKPNGTGPISGQGLSEYLAVAAPTHCADGWSYLSRAFHSYCSGDAHSAWHFAYYAELRAAQSILSTLGCAALNTWNAVVDSSGNIQTVPGPLPTHVMVWLATKYLLENSPDAADTVGKGLSILGHDLPELVEFAFPGRAARASSVSWITEWLFDLEVGKGDKDFRNRCSYNPHEVTIHRAEVEEWADLISTFWEACQPIGASKFLELDKAILRSALYDEALLALQLRGVTPAPANVQAELDSAYSRLTSGAPSVAAGIPVAYLTAGIAPSHPLLNHARDYSSNPDTPRPALARATLLLRASTGVVRNLLVEANQESAITFWLDRLAMQQGIVHAASELPVPRSDLYDDCRAATGDLLRRVAGTPPPIALGKLLSYPDVRLFVLSQAERIVQWGLTA